MAPLVPRVVTIVLAVALVASVTEWVLTFGARRTPAEPVRVLDASSTDVQGQVTDVAPVARLFGATGTSEAGGIRALGVMAEDGTGRGIAVLGVGDKPARSYRSGDTVAPGVVLEEVKKNSVVISRAGVPQELRITKTVATPVSPLAPAGPR